MPRIQTFNVAPNIPEALRPLQELAYDLAWTWNPEAERLFRRVDDSLWQEVNGNPVALLGRASQETLKRLSEDPSFLRHLERVIHALADEAQVPTWYGREVGGPVPRPPEGTLVAYFCAEFGLTEALPIYSGGLGVLAGDHLKSASSVGLPLVAVGLAYQEGYFHQYLNSDGWQQEAPYDNDFQMLPMRRTRFPDGQQVSVDILIEGRIVRVRVWDVKVGRTRLFLLDTNSPHNHPDDRNITYRLYGGDKDYRCKQEIVLGVGGFYVLQAMGITPTVFHMNEGHSAFMGLARIADLRRKSGLSFAEAREALAASNVFTTHTPVPAGFDIFSKQQLDRFMPLVHEELGIDRDAFYRMGAHENDPNSERGFNMAFLALRCSGWVNGVSQLHGQVSRSMWQCLWPGSEANEVPIAGITNGIHHLTWVGEEMRELLERYLGEKWRTDPAAPGAWAAVEKIPDPELWRAHERGRERMVTFVRERAAAQATRIRMPQSDVAALSEVLDPRALTIGFARRFATYKRATLFLRDPERLRKLLLDEERPIQFVFAGKAHPMDTPAKELIQQLVHFAKDPAIRRKIVFVEEYDMGVARRLVQGVDVWLNNPRRPKEASGTSGMKVVPNAGLNLSVLDGWWAEAWDGDNGWAIGGGETYEDAELGDAIEARELLEILENQVIPDFYARGADHLPHRWVARMKRSMATLSGVFNTDRMVREYGERMYFPAAKEALRMAQGDWSLARDLAKEAGRLDAGWGDTRIGEVKIEASYDLVLGQPVEMALEVFLGGVLPGDVIVEAMGGIVDGVRRIVDGELTEFMRVGDGSASGWHRYKGTWLPRSAGHNGCMLRLRPRFSRGAPARELAVRFWE